MDDLMEKVISLTKRRGFIYPSGEIYDGLAGFWDYGPLGVRLKENIKALWREQFVFGRDDVYEIDGAIVGSQRVFQASGHADGFTDPLVEDTKTGLRYRADHLLEEAGVEHPEELSVEEMNALIKERRLKSPEGNPLSEVRVFNLMFDVYPGPVRSEEARAYLRPETAQSIFVNFKNIVDSFSPKFPFGIAQIGKAYRNEIAPRNFIYRLRELEQMEIEYFVREADWEAQFEAWRQAILMFADSLGLSREKIREYEVPAADRAHYSKRTIDFEFAYPFGVKELWGFAYRTDYDLTKHQAASGERLQYLDPATNEWFTPHVLEPSMGVERTLLALLIDAYQEDEVDGKPRVFLKLSPKVAPYKLAVFPLLKNKPELVAKAQAVYEELRARVPATLFDDNGNIGKRYRRQDEIGTPYCVTIDFDTLEDDTVTVRERDSGTQRRVALSELLGELAL